MPVAPLTPIKRAMLEALRKGAAETATKLDRRVNAWRPHEGPQRQFIESEAAEVLYGGSAGGGKSFAAVALPIRWISNPDLRVLILRRRTGDLADIVDKAKKVYKFGKSEGVLSGLPKGLPALQRTARVIEKVTKVGFQWKDLTGPLEKLDEEMKEFRDEVQAGRTERAGEELGDLLFSLCNVAFLLKLNPEDSLRGTLRRFESRFKHVEDRLREQGRTPEQSSLDEMDRYWNEAKQSEKA
jgi:NTP pyrophosphatase (non-canonical NTP hydrolase)